MRDSKNIDRLFQENLKDFEVIPPNKVWIKIEKKLEVKPKRKRTPIWFKLASVAAILVFLFSAITIYLIPENNFTASFNPVINTDKDTNNNSDSLPRLNASATNNVVKVEDSNNNLNNQKEVNQTKASNDEFLQNNDLEETVISKNSLNKKSLADAISLPLQNNSNTEVVKPGEAQSKFTVATIFAPIYFSSADGSGIGEQFKDNPTSGTSSYSYGVKFAYKLNNKISLQSGVNLINLGLKTDNVYVTPGVAVVSLANIASNPVVSKNISKEALNGDLDSGSGSLNQVFGYVEIPVELKYNVTDGKFGVNIVGGFSTLLLNKDEVFIETNSFTQSLGSSNNLRSVNFSGNFGVDVDYLINKNLYINVSPMFKVQTNTFSKNTGSFQPYYLGVYTGLNYKF